MGLAGGFVRLGRDNLGLARMGDVRYEEDVRFWLIFFRFSPYLICCLFNCIVKGKDGGFKVP